MGSEEGGVLHVLHYLDDFLVMGHPNCGESQSALSTVMRVCKDSVFLFYFGNWKGL